MHSQQLLHKSWHTGPRKASPNLLRACDFVQRVALLCGPPEIETLADNAYLSLMFCGHILSSSCKSGVCTHQRLGMMRASTMLWRVSVPLIQYCSKILGQDVLQALCFVVSI